MTVGGHRDHMGEGWKWWWLWGRWCGGGMVGFGGGDDSV